MPPPRRRNRSAGLGGLLASLRIRRSAPPTTFESLDRDALSVVWRKLSEGPPEAARRNVLFLAMANKALLRSAAGDESARNRLLEAALEVPRRRRFHVAEEASFETPAVAFFALAAA